MTSRPILLFLIASLSPCRGGDAKDATISRGNWEFSLSAGPAYRQSGTLGFAAGSRSNAFPLPSFVGENVLVTPPIGPADATADREYDDGFVRLDGSTSIDGYTTYWGYENSSQVSGDNINFHATGFQSIRSDLETLRGGPSGEERERGIAPVIQFDARYAGKIAGIQPGFNVSFSWVPIELDRAWSDYSQTQTRDDYRHDWTDTYNLGGFGEFVPSAPYAGLPDAPGFTLENIPDSRGFSAVLIGSESASIANSVVTRFRADHTTMSFGPTLRREIDRSWSLDAGAGISLDWLHWSAGQHERLGVTQATGSTTLARWTDESSGNKLLAGLYFQVGAEWRPVDQPWAVKGYLRTDFGGKFSKQVGPSRISYDIEGFTAGLLLTYRL
jgi:hypothetical protein